MTATVIDLTPHLDRKRSRDALRRKLEGLDPFEDMARIFLDAIHRRQADRQIGDAFAMGEKIKQLTPDQREPSHIQDAAVYSQAAQPDPDHFYGSKYDRNLSIDDIVKRLRADILAEKHKKGSPFAGARITVRKRSITHSWGIRITVWTFPENPINPAWVKELGPSRNYNHIFDLHPSDRPDKYTKKARLTLDQLEALATAYNHDRSDTMTDYFDVRFYLDVDFDYKLEDNAEEDLRKEIFPHE